MFKECLDCIDWSKQEVLLGFWNLAIPLAITGISALSGLFSNRAKKQEQEQTQTETIDRSTMPQYDQKSLIMRDLLMDRYLGRTEDSGDLWGGYARQGLSNISRAANQSQESIANILAGRGLGNTAAGASSYISNILNRGNQQAALLNQIPLLRDQREASNLSAAGQFFSSMPVGQHITGTGTTVTKGTATQPGNKLGGIFGGLGSALGGLYGAGAFGNTDIFGKTIPTKYPTPTLPGYRYPNTSTTGYEGGNAEDEEGNQILMR